MLPAGDDPFTIADVEHSVAVFDDQPHQRVAAQPLGGPGADDAEAVQQRLTAPAHAQQRLQLHTHARARTRPGGLGQVGGVHAGPQDLLKRVRAPLAVGAWVGHRLPPAPRVRLAALPVAAAVGGVGPGLLSVTLGLPLGLAGCLGHGRDRGLELVGHRRVEHRVEPGQVTDPHDPHAA
jgi:hypothetical protein